MQQLLCTNVTRYANASSLSDSTDGVKKLVDVGVMTNSVQV